MMSRLAFVKNRIAGTVAGRGSALMVEWREVSGVPDELGAFDGTTTVYSGVLNALAVEEGARTALRQYQEIQVGDLIVDVPADPQVTLYAGQDQSGVVALAALAGKGPRFQWNGQWYSQKELGEELRDLWQLRVQNVNLMATLLLRKAT
jgi:hypothetical protein